MGQGTGGHGDDHVGDRWRPHPGTIADRLCDDAGVGNRRQTLRCCLCQQLQTDFGEWLSAGRWRFHHDTRIADCIVVKMLQIADDRGGVSDQGLVGPVTEVVTV